MGQYVSSHELKKDNKLIQKLKIYIYFGENNVNVQTIISGGAHDFTCDVLPIPPSSSSPVHTAPSIL